MDLGGGQVSESGRLNDHGQSDREPGRLHAGEALDRVDDTEVVHYDLDELISGITEENRHDLIDWGDPVGREVW